MNRADILNIFDNPAFAEVYLESEATTRAYEKHFSLLVENMPLIQGDKILDVGVAHGSSSLAIFRQQPDVEIIAADPSTIMLKIAEAKFKGTGIYDFLLQFIHNGAVLSYLADQHQECRRFADRITFIQKFAEDINLKITERVNHIVASVSLHWLFDPEKAFANFSAALKPGGTLGISSASWKYDMSDIDLQVENKFQDAPFVKEFYANLNQCLSFPTIQRPQPNQKWNLQKVQGLLQRNKFELIHYEEYRMPISLGHLFASCKAGAFYTDLNLCQQLTDMDAVRLAIKEALKETIKKTDPINSAENYYEINPYIVARKIVN